MTAIRAGAVVSCLIVLTACKAVQPTAPTPLQSASVVHPPPTAIIPVVAANARAYAFTSHPEHRVSHYTVDSHYVLRDDGTFSLHYTTLGQEYVGTFVDEGGRLSLRFANAAWAAAATLDGDLLFVRYNETAAGADFENASYKQYR